MKSQSGTDKSGSNRFQTQRVGPLGWVSTSDRFVSAEELSEAEVHPATIQRLIGRMRSRACESPEFRKKMAEALDPVRRLIIECCGDDRELSSAARRSFERQDAASFELLAILATASMAERE